MPPPAKAFDRRPLLAGLCYILAGALLSVLIAWTTSELGPNRVLTTANMGTLERDGLHLLVQSAQGAYWKLVRLIAQPDEAQARWLASHGGNEEVATPTVPKWALASMDSNAAQVKPGPAGAGAAVSVLAIGWPFVCLKGVQIRTVAGGTSSFADEGFIRLGRVGLCCLPLWPGLLLNSVIFGVMLLAVRQASRVCIRRLRGTSGRCPTCAYERRGLPPDAACPECGAPAPIAE